LPPSHPAGVIRALLAVPALLLLYVLILIPFTPSISNIRKASSEQPAQVVSADGRKLAEFKQSNRQWVALSEISPQVINALIATEDHRFYDHFGLDWRRTAAAALNTFRGDRQGGSTLTQQLARNLYPEAIGRAPTLTRKIKEAITALKIEAIHSKDEILETYLNTVPFLYNAYGIEMAARTYFDTSADQLDVLQSATLVGMLKGNSYYNPVLNPERSLQRRNTVLKQMVKREKLTQAQFDALSKKPLRIDFERQLGTPGAGPAFRQVSAQVADRLGRPQRLQHLRRRAGGTHHHRFPATGGGQPGRDAPGQQLAEPRQRGLGKALGVEHRLQPGAGLHPRIAGIRRRHRQGPDA
jgi:penicillin-binding protein 1A